MKTHSTRNVVLMSLLVIVVPTIGIMARRLDANRVRQQETKRATDTLPPVVSKVPTLEVVNAFIENRGKPGAAASIEVRNNSDKAIVEFTIESGDKANSSGLTTRIDDDSGAPTALVAPFSNYTMHWSLAEIAADVPIRISGVVYADGSEAGDETTLRTMRSQREHDKAERAARKGVKPN